MIELKRYITINRSTEELVSLVVPKLFSYYGYITNINFDYSSTEWKVTYIILDTRSIEGIMFYNRITNSVNLYLRNVTKNLIIGKKVIPCYDYENGCFPPMEYSFIVTKNFNTDIENDFFVITYESMISYDNVLTPKWRSSSF